MAAIKRGFLKRAIQNGVSGWLDAFYHYSYWKGRTNRSGFWSFAVMNGVILFLLFLMDEQFFLIYRIYSEGMYIDCHLLFTLYLLATLVPSCSLCIRRLHDMNLAGGWSLLLFIPIPYVHFIFQLSFLVLASFPGTLKNKYGLGPVNQFTS